MTEMFTHWRICDATGGSGIGRQVKAQLAPELAPAFFDRVLLGVAKAGKLLKQHSIVQFAGP